MRNLIICSCLCEFRDLVKPSLAKMLCSSLTRVHSQADVMLFRNQEKPLFRLEREAVKEQYIELFFEGLSIDRRNHMALEFLAALNSLIVGEEYDWVMMLECGVAIRNIDHLVHEKIANSDNTVDLFWLPCGNQSVGIANEASRGAWAVRGDYFHATLNEWIQAHVSTTDARGISWIDRIKRLPLRSRPFEKNEVYAPLVGEVDWEAVSNAAFVTVPDWPEKEQWKFLQALYFGTYFGDETGLMLNILDP